MSVLDSYPFQNSAVVLVQMGVDPITLAAYQSRMETQVTVLDPVLIYLDPGDAGPRSAGSPNDEDGPGRTT